MQNLQQKTSEQEANVAKAAKQNELWTKVSAAAILDDNQKAMMNLINKDKELFASVIPVVQSQFRRLVSYDDHNKVREERDAALKEAQSARDDIVKTAAEARQDAWEKAERDILRLRQERDERKMEVAELKIMLKKSKELANEELNELRSQRETSTLSAETSTSYTKAVKSDKLPDPPLFTNGSHAEYKSWERQMRDKLTINEDRYETETKKIAYASARISGVAMTFMEPYLDHDSAARVTSAEDFFMKMRDRFADIFARKTARDQFKRLVQHGRDFQVFLGEFQRLAAEGGFTEEEQMEELQDKVALDIQRALYGHNPTSLKELILQCRTIDRQQRATTRRTPQSNQYATSSTSATTASPKVPPPAQGTAYRQPNERGAFVPRPHKIVDVSTIRCFTCGQLGHYATTCPQRTGNGQPDSKS